MTKVLPLTLLLTFLYGCQTQSTSSLLVSPEKSDLDNPLLNLTVPTSWQPFEDYSRFLQLERKHMMVIPQPYTGECVEQWKRPGLIGLDNHRAMTRCYKKIFDEGYEHPRFVKSLLVGWANAENDPLTFDSYLTASNPNAYAKQSILGIAAYWYALSYHHPNLNLTAKERQAVDDYLTNRLIKEDFPQHTLEYEDCRNHLGNPENLTSTTDTNTCGSTVWKVALGSVALGMRLGNQDLFQKGNAALLNNLRMIDADGIYVPYASRGNNAYGYYREVPHFMSHFVELYKSIGFDFFTYDLPHGQSVKGFFDMAYKILAEDFHLMDKYAVLYNGVGSNAIPFNEIKDVAHKDFVRHPDFCNCGYFNVDTGHFYAMNPEYVMRFRGGEHSKNYKYKDDTSYFAANALSLHKSFK